MYTIGQLLHAVRVVRVSVTLVGCCLFLLLTAPSRATPLAAAPFAIRQSCSLASVQADLTSCLQSCQQDLQSPGLSTCSIASNGRSCCAISTNSGQINLCVNGCCFVTSSLSSNSFSPTSGQFCQSSGGGAGNSTSTSTSTSSSATPLPATSTSITTLTAAASGAPASTNTSSTKLGGLIPITPSPSPADNSSSSCFPASALVHLESGARIPMQHLQIGDSVLVAPETYSEVFMFTHKTPDVVASFVRIHTDTDHTIIVTPGHYLYLNGALAPALAAKQGDQVTLATGSVADVVDVTHTLARGLYNPQTLHGDIVVDGVIASTYTTAVSPAFGHLSLTPLRALYAWFGLSSAAFEQGADAAVVDLLPSGGPAIC